MSFGTLFIWDIIVSFNAHFGLQHWEGFGAHGLEYRIGQKGCEISKLDQADQMKTSLSTSDKLTRISPGPDGIAEV